MINIFSLDNLCSSQPTRHIAHGCLPGKNIHYFLILRKMCTEKYRQLDKYESRYQPNAIKEPVCTAHSSSQANAASNGSERLLKPTSFCLSVIQVVWLRGLQR